MNKNEIKANIESIVSNLSKDDFIYDFLLAYGLPKASISRLKNGNLNISKNQEEILWKKKLLFKVVDKNDLHGVIDNLKTTHHLQSKLPDL